MAGKTVTVKCKACQSPFEARVADRRRGWGRFCSKSCKAIHQERRSGQYRDWLNGADPDHNPEFSNAHQFDNCE
ncbi:hypothetical protein C7440_1707 [Pusillimonas noertemannii]|uniref:Uncharacterized protein n=1 Tax=Pusillimonas noertemannii TaxID=305977 RepID=A0A2U1CMI6_9BURK|nr:hypothetical protein C7440_1707 [Pusillimonas noertemannii]TFL10806.1 hypothetical protein CSC72_09830 [Pusillimonas noertemannii]